MLSDSEVRSRLGAARVGIIGLGGLGSNIAIMLARSGVRHFVLADFDVIEPSNLNRQAYFPDDLGRPKVEVLAETLRRLDPEVDLTLHQSRVTAADVKQLFGRVDVLVEAVDSAEGKAELVRAASDSLPGTPLVWAMGLAGYASANAIRTEHVGAQCWVAGDFEADVRTGLPLLASRVMVAAAHEAHAAVRLLLGMSAP
jgi:sulfur carrier protein ThiS adenylyltransferase